MTTESCDESNLLALAIYTVVLYYEKEVLCHLELVVLHIPAIPPRLCCSELCVWCMAVFVAGMSLVWTNTTDASISHQLPPVGVNITTTGGCRLVV